MPVTSDDKHLTIYIGKLVVTYSNGVTLTLISNSYGIRKLNDEGVEKKKFNDDIKIIDGCELKLEEVIAEINALNNKSDALNKFKNICDEERENLGGLWKDFFEKLKRKYQVKNIKAIDFALEFNQERNEYYFSEDNGIRIQIPLKDSDTKGLKIYDRCCIGLSETGTYDIIIESKDEEEIKIGLRRQKGYITPFGSSAKEAYINFNGQTFFGSIPINIQAKGLQYELPVLVFPVKLDIHEAETLVNDLIDHWDKVLSEKTPTELHYEPGEIIERSPVQTLILVKEIFENGFNRISLKKVLSAIQSHPDRVLEKRMVEREIQDAQEVTSESITEAIIEGKIRRVANASAYHFSYPVNSKNNYAFTKIKEEESYISFDTPPNRFLKYFLRYIERIVNSAIKEMQKDKKQEPNDFPLELINKVRGYINHYINPFLNLDWVKEISEITFLPPPSQKLLKDIYYSSAFYDYLDLIKNLKLLDKELEKYLKNPVKSMPKLYEIWCGIKLKELLGKKIEEQKSFGPEGTKDKYFSYSLPLRPDFVIQNGDNLILFDAKYRVDFIDEIEKISEEENKKSEKLEEIKQEEHRGTFKLGDLYKMHTYREAIIEKDNKIKRPVWVFALYPGETLALFFTKGEKIVIEVENLKFEIIRDNNKLENEEYSKFILERLPNGGVGAIPFRPGLLKNKEYEDFLREMFKKWEK